MINDQDETKHRKQMNALDRKYEKEAARQGSFSGTTYDHGNYAPEQTPTGRAIRAGRPVDVAAQRPATPPSSDQKPFPTSTPFKKVKR